ncbi:MAG: 16S rRNA (adenine(1518)-N(6)/adenine(1519)-N(6))-dimethyltransferase RsmA [Cyanobacteriota bacterium]
MNYLQTAREFKYKKRLGQNFLIDSNVIEAISSAITLNKEETILEIGAGLGFVTNSIADKVKKVIAIEIDTDAIEYLKKLNHSNIDIISEDILKLDLSTLTKEKVKVIANIPYYITSPILVHLIGEIDDIQHANRELISEIVIMVQKEVGKRILATHESKNKEWGALSILLNYWTEPQLIKDVSKTSFWPRPKVDSSILHLRIRENPVVKVLDTRILKKIVKACFNFRRKTLKNSLFLSGFSSNIITKAFRETELNDKIRGESLSIEELATLSDIIYQLSQEEHN